jgi:hypothetical protein
LRVASYNLSAKISEVKTFFDSMANALRHQNTDDIDVEEAKAAGMDIEALMAFANVTVTFAENVSNTCETLANYVQKITDVATSEAINYVMFYDDNFFEPAYEMFDDFDDDFDLDMYDYDDYEYSHSGSMFDEDFFD